MRWILYIDDDSNKEYWFNDEVVREVSRADANLPPLYTYPASGIESVPLAGPTKNVRRQTGED